jgi:hypothetical protein
MNLHGMSFPQQPQWMRYSMLLWNKRPMIADRGEVTWAKHKLHDALYNSLIAAAKHVCVSMTFVSKFGTMFRFTKFEMLSREYSVNPATSDSLTF